MAARLGAACRAARLQSELRQSDIAAEAVGARGRPLSTQTITNFEKGAGWSDYTDEIVRAYARCCHTRERDLWRRALDSDGP